ncbi:TDP-N-acetylfucosamine:lipid II N-acetylfucosaminyltransferase [Bizionia sediminis]|uniref:TDP-N-acetylfucosamine:lipid II N-acetylfucosaminyltransferase n=1 Tax=Bizionia sediminis TaxID=1737064 RepID=A0ABW5KSN8_9FLAO
MNILHFAFDEKVIPLTHSLYEQAFPGKNTWKIFVPSQQKTQFVTQLQDVSVVSEGYFNSETLEIDLQNADCIVIHYLFRIHKNVLEKVPSHTLVVWHSWGRDYAHLLAPYTTNVTMKRSKYLERFSKSLEFLDPKITFSQKISRLKQVFIKQLKQPDFLYQRIDVVSIQPELYPILRKAIPTLRAKNHYLNSYTVENTYAIGPPAFSGNAILLGNSAYASNNHIEAILMLKKLPLQTDTKIITPLNYGSSSYAKLINYFGKKHLGASRFEGLTDFLPLADYYTKIKDCGIVIMNHTRQQARGNINTALYKGAKVFLRNENPIYQQCKQLGMHIFSVQDLETGLANTQALSAAQINHNKAILESQWSRAHAIRAIKALAHLYTKKNK